MQLVTKGFIQSHAEPITYIISHIQYSHSNLVLLKLVVKRIPLLSAYLLSVLTHKRMRLTTSFYGSLIVMTIIYNYSIIL